MTEIQAVPNKFTTIQFTTKDGEKCTATKKNGIVTVVGDKNGIRQVPFDDFMKDFVENLPKVDLVKTPAKDTVQFSGAENPVQKTQEKETKTPEKAPEKTSEKTSEKELPPEEDKSVAINKKNLTIGGAITLIAMAGLYMFGRGRWWSKAAQNIERKGNELVDDLTNTVKDGLKAGEKNPSESVADEVVQSAEELTGRKPAIKIEPQEPKETDKVLTVNTESPKPELIISKTEEPVVKVEQSKQPETKSVNETVVEGEQNTLRTTSPIPESEMFVIPKDLEIDVEKIIKNGKCDNTPLIIEGKQVYGYKLETPEGYSRIYYISDDKEILNMNEFYKNNIIPFRIFNFEHGQVRSITDNTKTTLQKKFFHVEKPKMETAQPEPIASEADEAVNSAKPISVGEWKSLHPRPAVPIEQIFDIPKDLELNPEKVLKSAGTIQEYSSGKKVATVQPKNPDIRRVYTISPENEILYVEEFGAEEILPTRAFRRFKIKNGHVSEIINKTEDGFPTRYIGNEYTGTLKRVNPPKLAGADIERTGAFEIPTDIEFNVKTIMAIGDKEHTIKWLAFGKKQVTLNLPNGITRRYLLDAKNNITMIVETKGGKERWISFKDGKPVSITAEGSVMELTPEEQDLIMANKKELPNILKKKPAKKQQTVVAGQPKQKVEPQKEPEPTLVRTSQQQQDDLLRQEQELARKQQEAVDRANEDIINAAVIADISTQGAKKGIKPVAESLNPENVARQAEDAADDLFGLHPERVGEDFTAYNPTGTVDTFEPRIDFETPKIADDIDGLNNLGIDNLDNGMPHIDEPDIFSDFGGDGLLG